MAESVVERVVRDALIDAWENRPADGQPRWNEFAQFVLAALRSAGYDPDTRYEQVGWATRWPKAFSNQFPWSLRDCRENPNDHYGYTDKPSWVPVFRRVDTPNGEAGR